MTSSNYEEVELQAPDEHWRHAMHMLLKNQTAPILAKALQQLALLRADPLLTEPLRADATLTAISIAESAILLDCLLEGLVDPQKLAVTRRPLRHEARRQFLEYASSRAATQ
jgi:hypothetical protein